MPPPPHTHTPTRLLPLPPPTPHPAHVQIDTATEVHALRLLLEAADLTLPELEKLVLRQRGEPLSRLLLNAARSGWSKMSILPALGSEFDLSRRQVAEALLKFPGGCWPGWASARGWDGWGATAGVVVVVVCVCARVLVRVCGGGGGTRERITRHLCR